MKEKKNSFVLWLTGLSNAGKTTIGDRVYRILKEKGLAVIRLDGDIIRKTTNKNLGFSKGDRNKNIEIVASIVKSFNDEDNIVIASFISPYREQRGKIRRKTKKFIEVYLSTPLEICEKRDTEGLYQKVRLGKIKNFTGISHPYEPPLNPEIELRTDKESISQSVNRVIRYLIKNGYLK